MRMGMRASALALAAGAAAAASLTVNSQAEGSTPSGVTTSWVTVSPSVETGSGAPSRLAADDDEGVTSSYAVATTYDVSTGQALARKRYRIGSEHRALKVPMRTSRDDGSGGSSTTAGCVKVEVWQRRTTLLGAFAAKWGVWTDWCWDRGQQQVTVNEKGKDFDVAPGYSFDGVTDRAAYFYDYGPDDGHPKSGYHFHVKGGFSSPTGDVLPGGHWYPKNTLDSHCDGTFLWYTSD